MHSFAARQPEFCPFQNGREPASTPELQSLFQSAAVPADSDQGETLSWRITNHWSYSDHQTGLSETTTQGPEEPNDRFVNNGMFSFNR